MKPLQLTMSAFGPYSETQTIDFTRLGENGIYLVTGETGSGKTTIFDAVSFALFGKASGKGRDDYKMLRSDFANEKTRTYVELNFDSGGHRYTIKRTIKKTGKDVGLTLPDKTSVSGETKVNEKIAEIVGLNRDQFSQIVMIAQNDFMRFLQSGSDKRSEILRHIFRTENLKRFQERLKERMKSESDHFNRTLHFFQRYDVDVRRRDVKFAEWESQINADNTVLTNVETRLKDYDERKNRLAGKQAVAEELDKKFADLSKCRNNLARHQAQAEDMVVLRYRTARGEAALRRVKPLADQAKKAADDHSAALAELADAKTRETAAGTEREEAIKAVEVLPPLAEVKDAFDVLKKEWEVSANHLERLAALQNNRKEIRCKQEFLAEKQDELAAVTTGLGTLPLIADCQNELLKISEDLKRAEEKKSGLLPLLNEFSEISDSQVELTEEQKKFAALHEDYCMIDEKYRMMEEAFLRSQAGILAGGLTAGEPCPVCGSVGHPAPAKLSESDVTDAKLKKAKETRDQAQAKREAKSASCGALKTRVETLTRRFTIDLAALIPDATIETAATLLPEMIRATQSEASEYAAMKSAAEKTLKELTAKTVMLTKKRDELSPEIAALQSEVDTLLRLFLNDLIAYDTEISRENSEEKLTALFTHAQLIAKELTARVNADERSLNELSVRWDVATKRKAEAEADEKAAQTLTQERAAKEHQFMILRNEAQTACRTALSENGFADEAEYHAALATEVKLAELNKQILEYEKQGEQLTRDIDRLEEETAGKERPDLEKMRKEAETIQAETLSLGKQRDELKERLSETKRMLHELRLAAADIVKIEKTYAAVKQLADAANGKLDFETYMQAAYFKRVLRAANLRLKRMSQNRYTLLHKTDSDDGRKSWGLELEVLDAYTGKARSANSLSGGESFMTSLSLALGLSDIVQHNAGGIRLETMFIDEGFGSLDSEVLELAVATLAEMTGANRTIGIISHVSELRERVEKQIQVEKTTTGSKIRIKA